MGRAGRQWMRGACVASLSLGLVGCPEEDPKVATTGTGKLTLPDRVRTSDASVVVRFLQGNSTTTTAVHRGLSRLFTFQVDPTAAILRGGYDPGSAATGAAALAGSSGDQVRALLSKVSSGGGTPFSAAESVDPCGNPMVAAFVTPDVLGAVTGDSPWMTELLSKDACASEGGCDTTSAGVWDITLTEERYDGMVDAVLQLYPAVKEERPGFLGHVAAFFLTNNTPGFWQAPLFLAADKVQISLQGLLELDRTYTDRHYGDARAMYRFPHMRRTVARKDLTLAFLGDPLCDEHHAAQFDGALPVGCNLPDGRDLPVQVDPNSPVGATLRDRVLERGKKPAALDDLAEVLAYQLSAYLACPTFEQPRWVRDGVVEVFVCPDGGVDACVGFHDMEQAGCDADRGVGQWPVLDLEVPFETGRGEITPTDTVQLVTLGAAVVGEQGGGASARQFDLSFTAAPGQAIVLYGEAIGRASVRRGDGGAVVAATDRADSHCPSEAAREWQIPEAGTYTLRLDGTADARLLFTTPSAHVP